MKMKNRFFVLMLIVGALSMTLASCNEDILPDNGEENKGNGVRTVKLGLQIESATKVTLSEGSTTVQSYFEWETGDKIGVWVGTSSSDAGGSFQEFSVSEDDGGNKQISGDIFGGKNRFNYAVYPYSVNHSYNTSTGALTIKLKNSYALSEVSGTKAPLPMLAVNENSSNSLIFYNVGGMLRLTVNDIPADATYLQIDFEGKQVCGDFTIASPNPGNSTISTSTISESSPANAGDIITITGLGDATSAVVNVNIPLPIGEYGSSIKVSVYNSSDVLLMAVDQTFGYNASRAKGKMIASSLPAITGSGSLIKFDFNNITDPNNFTTINNIRFVRIFSEGGLLGNGPITISGNTDVGYQYVYAGLQFTAPNDNDPLVFQVIDKDGKVYSGSLDSHDNFEDGNSYEVTANVKVYTFSVASGQQVYFSPGDLGVDNGVYSFTEPFAAWNQDKTSMTNKTNPPAKRTWFIRSEVQGGQTIYGIDWRIQNYASEWKYLVGINEGRTINHGNVSLYYKVHIKELGDRYWCYLLPPDEATADDIKDDLINFKEGTEYYEVTDYLKYIAKGFVLLMDTEHSYRTSTTGNWTYKSRSDTHSGYYQSGYVNKNKPFFQFGVDGPTYNTRQMGWDLRLHTRYIHNVTP